MDTTYYYATLPHVVEDMQRDIADLTQQVEVLNNLLNRVVDILREEGHSILPHDFSD